MDMIMGGGQSPMFKPGQVLSAKDQAKQVDAAVTQQLQGLGFSPDYIKQLLGSVQTARQQYEDYLKKYLEANPGLKADAKAPKATEEEKYASSLAQFSAGAAYQNMLVMQSVAMASLGLTPPPGAAPPAAEPKK